MKNSALLAVSLLVVICSCKKGNNNPAPPPQGPDTAYLVKTENTYSFDPTGTKITDSSLYTWTYDDKRRTISTVLNSHDAKDTISYSYSSGQTVTNDIFYSNSIILSKEESINYINSSGLVDSSLSTGYNVSVSSGVPSAPQPYSAVGYIRYDANGNAISDSSYNLLPSKALSGYSFSSYNNNSLLSVSQFNAYGKRTSVDYYEAGNVVSDTIYTSDYNPAILMIHAYTYLPALSGGFINYGGGTKNLLQTITQTGFQGITSYIETTSYTFDGSNRVISMIYQNASGIITGKAIFTYY